MAQEIKRSPASLYGGIVIALVVFALWVLILWQPTLTEVTVGAAVALAIGIWTRLANL